MRIQKFRYAFILGNILSTFLGVAILVVAVLSFFILDKLPEFLGDVLFDTVIRVGCAVIGLIMFGLGIVGWCGAYQKRRSMLGTFAVVVFILFLAQIGITVCFIVREDMFQEVFNRTWKLLDKQTTGRIESQFECHGPEDFTNSTSTTSSESQEHCLEALMKQFHERIAVYIILALIICVLQIISIILAMLLFCAPKKQNQVLSDEESYPRLSRWAESRM